MLLVINALNKILEKIFVTIAGILLLTMVLLTCANIVGRIFHQPINGTVELMGLCGAVVVALGLAYSQRKKEHIAVDLLTNRFPPLLKKTTLVVSYLAGILFSIIAAWQIIRIAGVLHRSGEVTETLRIIYYPFTYIVGFGFITMALAFTADILATFNNDRKATK
jgi:TRAP-type C4-dicarboxylate transport system permease small subunit